MVKLSRRWRISHGKHEEGQFSLPTYDDLRPMDTQEQEELVLSFERKQAQASTLWRGVFAAIQFCFALFFVFSIIQQASSPWELRYHAYFMDEVDPRIIIFADSVAVLACLMAVIGLLRDLKSQRQWIWYSCYTGVLLAVFWLYHMLRLPTFHWDIIWLPLGPLSGAGLCLYVDNMLLESLEDVRKLRSYMYSYKSN